MVRNPLDQSFEIAYKPPRGRSEFSRIKLPTPMTQVSLDLLHAQGKDLNEIDRFLSNVASYDDNANILDDRDFTAAVTNEDREAFLWAAGKYLESRITLGEDNEEIKKKFLEKLSVLKSLTSRYLPESIQLNAPNPLRLPPILRGRLSALLFLGQSRASTTIGEKGGHEWTLWTPGLGLELEFPFDLVRYLNLGFVSTVQKVAEGSLERNGTRLADVSGFAASLGVIADYRRPTPIHWLDWRLGAGVGFEAGRYSLDKTDAGREQLPNQCELNVEMAPVTAEGTEQTLDDAGESFSCRLERTVGGFTTFPLMATAGVEFLDALALSVLYRYVDLDVGDKLYTPDPRHDLWLVFGARFF